MIRSHLYVKNLKSPVYASPQQTDNPSSFLERGNWVGVLEKMGEWVKVAGVHCIGWVKASELESRPPLDLHIHQINPLSFDYVNAVD